VIRRFNRFELKYILPVSKTTGYPVVSLYYDSPDYACFWSKVEGLRFRRKVRLRIYPDGDIRDVRTGSIEIKQRINKTVQKRRLELPLDQAEALCAGRFEPKGLDPLDQQVADEVTYLSRSEQLAPAAITAYWRRAYEGRDENAGLRVTFDTFVGARVHALTVNAPALNRLILPEDWCIMEVKADDRVPEWVTSLLGRHDCQLSRISKYCAGMAVLRRLSALPLVLSPGVPIPAEPAQRYASYTGAGPNGIVLEPRLAPEALSQSPEPSHG
jgi:hypothetical protein